MHDVDEPEAVSSVPLLARLPSVIINSMLTVLSKHSANTKKYPLPETFVDISAVSENFCMKLYVTVTLYHQVWLKYIGK